MSQDNVEVVRRFIQEFALKRDELPSIISTFWDADCDYYPVRKFPDAVARHSREEVSRFMVQFHETWDRFEQPIKQLLPVGDDRVLAITAMRAEVPGSRVMMEGDIYQCIWLRHGLIFRWEDHLTLKGALYALGLRGETLNAAGLEEYAVSRTNLETLRDAYEWVRVKGEFPAHLATPGVIWDLSHFQGWLGQQVYEGVQAVEDFFADWGSVWDSWEPAVESLHDVGDKVVAILRVRGRSKMSGTPIEMSMAQVVTFRDGKQARTDNYSDVDEALKVVGLEA